MVFMCSKRYENATAILVGKVGKQTQHGQKITNGKYGAADRRVESTSPIWLTRIMGKMNNEQKRLSGD